MAFLSFWAGKIRFTKNRCQKQDAGKKYEQCRRACLLFGENVCESPKYNEEQDNFQCPYHLRVLPLIFDLEPFFLFEKEKGQKRSKRHNAYHNPEPVWMMPKRNIFHSHSKNESNERCRQNNCRSDGNKLGNLVQARGAERLICI